MNKYRIYLIPLLASISLVASCEQNETSSGTAPVMQVAQAPAQASGNTFIGTVTETMDAGGYTYVQVDTGSGAIWAAGPQTNMEVGRTLTITSQMPMANFRSESLGRDFDMLYFVGSLDGGQSADEAYIENPHGNVEGMSMGEEEITIAADIAKADGGLSIAEIFADPQPLSEQSIRVRGVVIKYTQQVLGKDWLHIRDTQDGQDLTITTTDVVALGDMVVAEGKVMLNKDFGYGYTYDVIMEDAQVTVE